MKTQSRGVDAKIISDGAANHHQEEKTLRSQCRKARPHENADKQAARGPGHRKPKAFQNVGEFPHAGSHRGNPARITRSYVRTFSCCMKEIAGGGNPDTVIPGRCEASSPESRDSPMRNCASEVWCSRTIPE